MQVTRKKIIRISCIFACLLGIVISLTQAKAIGKFSCNFEVANKCQWSQDSSDQFDWRRHQGHTLSENTGPTTDHTKGCLENRNQGPGSIQHHGGKCIHILKGGNLVIRSKCGEEISEFQLGSDGILMHTKHSICVKPVGPVTDGVKVGVYRNCDACDQWSWTNNGSLQYKKKMCLQPETGSSNPKDGVNLVLDSACDKSQNFFKFVPTRGWYLYIETSGPRQPNDVARYISPTTTKAKSCLYFYYHMYGANVGKLQVYVKSGGMRGLPVWSRNGNHGNAWYQAQVAVNNQNTSYQYVVEGVRGNDVYGDIAIDDIFLMDSCIGRGGEWPSGGYGLPKPRSGCPSSKTSVWREGWRDQDMEDDDKSDSSRSRVSSGLQMDVKLSRSKRDVNRTFCMKQNTEILTKSWPNGSYCIYKNKDADCPKSMTSGWVIWDDENDRNFNKNGGSLPDGVYDKDTRISYCCKTDGNWYDSIELPVVEPFYLLTSSSTTTPKCQMVKWAFNYLEYIVFDTEDQNNTDSQGGNHVFTENGRTVYYCYYEDCGRTMMTTSSGSFRSHQAPVSQMGPHSQYCSWSITIAEAFVVSLIFKELTIPSCDDTFLRIYDGLNDTAPLLGTYCGPNATTQLEILSSTNSLYVVSNSGSYGSIFWFYGQYKSLREKQQTNCAAFSPSQDNSSKMIIMAASLSGCLFLSIVVIIVLLVKYKRRNRDPKLSTPVNIPLGTVENSQASSPVYEEPDNPEYAIPAATQTVTYKEPKISPQNPGYTELNKNGLEDRNTTVDSAYQKLLKRDSDYVIPADESTGSYEEVKVERNLPGYEELDQTKRESEDYPDYQKLVKT